MTAGLPLLRMTESLANQLAKALPPPASTDFSKRPSNSISNMTPGLRVGCSSGLTGVPEGVLRGSAPAGGVGRGRLCAARVDAEMQSRAAIGSRRRILVCYQSVLRIPMLQNSASGNLPQWKKSLTQDAEASASAGRIVLKMTEECHSG